MDRYALAVENMDHLLDIELVLFFASHILYLVLVGNLFLNSQLGKLLLELAGSFLLSVEHQDLKKEVEEVDDGVGVGKEFILRVLLLGYDVGFFANLSFEVF